jgi:hypothetical protein
MSRLHPFPTFLFAATLFAGAFPVLVWAEGAGAQEPSGEAAAQGASPSSPSANANGRQRRPYSRLNLSDIWGPAEMPKPPMDFGPHFDFPPETLNGPPLHDPYPN